MNGAEAFIETLHACGVEVCFANPGTSEMQLVAAVGRLTAGANTAIEHMVQVFHLAREHAPHAQLVYNDFMSWGAGNAKHRAGVLSVRACTLLQSVLINSLQATALGARHHSRTVHLPV